MQTDQQLPFSLEIINQYQNLRLWVHSSPCAQGIILFDLDFLREEKVELSRYLKLVPEDCENVVYFGKDRKVEPIPAGDIKTLQVIIGCAKAHVYLEIKIEYRDGTEWKYNWITD